MNTNPLGESATSVTNDFIDLYMGDANGSQIKIYLYLLRMMQAGLPTSVSDIADKFNDTEKDIMRALTYWEKKGLLGLEYDRAGRLSGVFLEDIPTAEVAGDNKEKVIAISGRTKSRKRTRNDGEKDDQQLVFLAEQYFGRTISPTDMEKLFLVHHEFDFSIDLMDYLMQYCAELGKKDFRYMEKVAEGWKEAGITTPDQARAKTPRYSKEVYSILRELGQDSSPAPAEVDFIEKWTKDFGFSTDIIYEACRRTVLSTQKNRIQYADGILKSWKESGVSGIEDIARLDSEHKTAPARTAGRASRNSNVCLKFQQNTYDFDELEKDLLKN